VSVVLVTGSAGLIGSETVSYFCDRGFDVVGIDNNFRQHFFGPDASTTWNRDSLMRKFPKSYSHHDADIRDHAAIDAIFAAYGDAITLALHAAAQPSHDWAASHPFLDFTVNANGSLVMLEAARKYAPEAVFIFTSTNKVYGDAPKELSLVEEAQRWELPGSAGIDETMRIDQSKHSLFGASKVAADILVQEYGRYFGMKTGVFRGGCLTGPNHSGTQLHGFLAYLMKCNVIVIPYMVFGYKGKQVRDNIHSFDLVAAFDEFYRAARVGEVYDMGGSRFSNCSMLEAIEACERLSGREMKWTYSEDNRIGDHIWYISDTTKFQSHYPSWHQRYNLDMLLRDIYEKNVERWMHESEHPMKIVV